MIYNSLGVKGETPIIKLNTEVKLKEPSTVRVNINQAFKMPDLSAYDLGFFSEINDFVDKTVKSVNKAEQDLFNTMLDKCGINWQYIFDHKDKFLYVPHGNAKSLFYDENLMFTIITELKDEDDEYSTHFGYAIYVSEDNSEKIRKLLQ